MSVESAAGGVIRRLVSTLPRGLTGLTCTSTNRGSGEHRALAFRTPRSTVFVLPWVADHRDRVRGYREHADGTDGLWLAPGTVRALGELYPCERRPGDSSAAWADPTVISSSGY